MAEVRLRALSPADWEIFRNLRLRALSLHPGYYCGTLEDARARPDQEWKEMLDGQGKQIFGLFDGETLIGITAVFTDREDATGQTGVFAMSFIDPDYRGRGYADLFYKARIAFGVSYTPWTRLCVSHRADNEPSKRAILRHGFTLIGQKEKSWPDGKNLDELMYELDLEASRKKA